MTARNGKTIEITRSLFDKAGQCKTQSELFDVVEPVLANHGYMDKGLSWQEQADEINNDAANDDDDLAEFLEYAETRWFCLP